MTAVTLAEVKDHLNITTSDNDNELAATLLAAEAVIAHRVIDSRAPSLEPFAVTEKVSGGCSRLLLSRTPVVSLTALAPVGGSALTVSGYTANPVSGIVESVVGDMFGAGSYTVTYQVGWASLPPDVVMAVKELTRHLWRTQRGALRRPGATGESGGATYLLPYAVQSLIEPFVKVTVA